MANCFQLKILAAVFLILASPTLTAQSSPAPSPEASEPEQRAAECRASALSRGLSLVARHCIVACDPARAAQSSESCDASYAKFRRAAFPDQYSPEPSNNTAAPTTGRRPRVRNNEVSTGPTSLQSVPDAIGYIRSRKGFHDLLNDDLEHRRLCGLRFEMKTEAGEAALSQLKEQTRIRLTGIEVTVDDRGRRVGTCKAADFQIVDQ